MTNLSERNHMFRVLLGNQATLHVFKNEAMVSNNRANWKPRNIGGIDGIQSGMSAEQIWDIPYVRVDYFNKSATNIVSWSKCVKLGMDSDYFKA